MIANTSSPSPALLAANERLYELRQQQQQQIERPSPSQSNCTQQPIPALPPWESPCVSTKASTAVQQIKQLSSHLGWGSAAATHSIRASLKRQQQQQGEPLTADYFQSLLSTDDNQPTSQPPNFQSSLPAKRQTPLPLYKDTIKH
jgi:hypothetical protein